MKRNEVKHRGTAARLLSVLIMLMVAFACSSADTFAAAKVKAPGKVKGVSASAAGNNAVTVKWKKVKGAKGYAIYCGGELAARAAGGRTTSYTVDGLEPGTKYGFYVRAYKTAKIKKWLNTKTGKYQKKKPAKKYNGGSKKVPSYKYGKRSVTVTAKTGGKKPAGKRGAAGLDPATLQNEMLAQINAQRAAAGLVPLQTEPMLNDLAMEKAADMYNNSYFDHTSPTWGDPSAQFDMHHVSGFAGENIAWGQQTISEVMNSWMNSPGHRANILNAYATHVGMAYCEGYWVQQFSRNPAYWGCERCGGDLRYAADDYIRASFSYTPEGSEAVLDSFDVEFARCAGCGTEYFYEESLEELGSTLDEWETKVGENESCLDFITWYDSSGNVIECPFDFSRIDSGSAEANAADTI